jgi:archaemetzincin
MGVLLFFMLSLITPAMGCSGRQDAQEISNLMETMERLKPLHKKLGKPRPGDWLATHPESGQSFRAYLDSGPVKPDRTRQIIYIQPLGAFTPLQVKIIALTAEFMGSYFGVSVKLEEVISLSLIPERARRVHPSWGNHQILTSYVLDEVLKPRLKKDALALIAFTPADLWPGEGWNFVFGQASLRGRVGVWSIYRNGDPTESEDSFRLCLLRTLKTATHEMGHMISMLHCIQYECNMCGSNHREESDRRPLALCPECLAKLCWATRIEPEERFKDLAAFCQKQGLEKEAAFFQKSWKVLTKGKGEPQENPEE